MGLVERQVLIRRSGLRPGVSVFLTSSQVMPTSLSLEYTSISRTKQPKEAFFFFLVYKVLLRMAPAEAFP